MFHTLLYLEDIDWFEFRMKLLFCICFFVFRLITLRSLKAYWMNSCSDLMPSQTACTTLCPPKLVATGKTVLSTHPYQLTWTHRWNINALFQTWQKCVFWKVSAVWTLQFCYRTLSEHNCQMSQWWVKQMSLPVKILYLLLTYRSNIFFPEPAQIVEPPLPNTKIEMTEFLNDWINEFLSCQVQVWTCDTSVPATETPNRRQFVLRLHHDDHNGIR